MIEFHLREYIRLECERAELQPVRQREDEDCMRLKSFVRHARRRELERFISERCSAKSANGYRASVALIFEKLARKGIELWKRLARSQSTTQ